MQSKEHALIQQFTNLQKEWKSLEKSRPRNPRTCSINSHISIITSFDQRLQNSPGEIMPSLQHRKSTRHRVLRVENCSMAVQEILMDRRDAIMSGRFKGRRLFGAAKRASGEESDLNYGGEICSDWLNDRIQQREVIINHDGSGKRSLGREHVAFSQSCSFSDSSPSEEKVVMEEVKKVVEVANAAEKRGGDRRRLNVRWCIVAMAWFAVMLILIMLVLVFISCDVRKYELMILVPT